MPFHDLLRALRLSVCFYVRPLLFCAVLFSISPHYITDNKYDALSSAGPYQWLPTKRTIHRANPSAHAFLNHIERHSIFSTYPQTE